MKAEVIRNLVAKAQHRLGKRAQQRQLQDRFRHNQVDIWTRAFNQADRNGRIAYCLATLLALSLALNIVQQGRPANVIFVDQVGNAKYFPELASPEPPRQYEAEHFCSEWVSNFLSRNATTVDEDIARALTVTDSPLREQLKAQIVDSGDIEKARAAHVESKVVTKSVKTLKVSADNREMLVEGERILKAIGSNRQMPPEPFAITLLLRGVERGPLTPNGLLVKYVTGSFGDSHTIGSSQ